MSEIVCESHGPPTGMPVFSPEGGEIMDIRILSNGDVQISYEGSENPERLETEIMKRTDYLDLVSNQKRYYNSLINFPQTLDKLHAIQHKLYAFVF